MPYCNGDFGFAAILRRFSVIFRVLRRTKHSVRYIKLYILNLFSLCRDHNLCTVYLKINWYYIENIYHDFVTIGIIHFNHIHISSVISFLFYKTSNSLAEAFEMIKNNDEKIDKQEIHSQLKPIGNER